MHTTILKLIMNETMLVVDIIKPVAVSRLLIKRQNYMVCVYRLQMAECRNLD